MIAKATLSVAMSGGLRVVSDVSVGVASLHLRRARRFGSTIAASLIWACPTVDAQETSPSQETPARSETQSPSPAAPGGAQPNLPPVTVEPPRTRPRPAARPSGEQ